MPSNIVPTRVMVISDTHEHSFDGTTMPSVDVLIHTGDMTNFGELGSLRQSVRMMGTIEAELKLVIAGNHDITLDPNGHVENMSEDEYSRLHEDALEIMTGALAKEAGVTYLEEGTHTFTLNNGATFTVYASPYIPGDGRSGGWAFQYSPSEDRFNLPLQTLRLHSSIARNPIPTYVDIVMTHGPPYSILDEADFHNVGCPNLLQAVSRVRPLMHCFGHIHEGYGANIVTWMKNGGVMEPEKATPLETEQVNEYPYPCEWGVERVRQTLMVNASFVTNGPRWMRADNKPFVVVLNLPRG